MNITRTTNPIFGKKTYDRAYTAYAGDERMTLNGTINKTALVILFVFMLFTGVVLTGYQATPDDEITLKENELKSKKQEINALTKDIKRLQAEENALKNDKSLTSKEKERKSRKLKQLIKDKTYLKNNLQWWVSQAENVQDNLSQKREESELTKTNFETLQNSFEKEFIDLFMLSIPKDNNSNIRKKMLLKSLMAYQEDIIFNLDTDYLKTRNVITQNENKLSNINEKIESKQKQQDEVDQEYTEYKQVTEELESKIANLSDQEAKVLKQRKALLAEKERLERDAAELELFIDNLILGKSNIDASKLVNNILIKRPCQGNIIKEFGANLNQLSKVTNKGVEINATPGSPVKAVFDGEVIYSGLVRSRGQLAIIDHLNGFASVYANNSTLKVKKGDLVKQGDVIGISGTDSDGRPVVYFELRKNNIPVNPKVYFQN
jgi:septal ring factor EnvC (AmiA/AmiB activator)